MALVELVVSGNGLILASVLAATHSVSLHLEEVPLLVVVVPSLVVRALVVRTLHLRLVAGAWLVVHLARAHVVSLVSSTLHLVHVTVAAHELVPLVAKSPLVVVVSLVHVASTLLEALVHAIMGAWLASHLAVPAMVTTMRVAPVGVSSVWVTTMLVATMWVSIVVTTTVMVPIMMATAMVAGTSVVATMMGELHLAHGATTLHPSIVEPLLLVVNMTFSTHPIAAIWLLELWSILIGVSGCSTPLMLLLLHFQLKLRYLVMF